MYLSFCLSICLSMCLLRVSFYLSNICTLYTKLTCNSWYFSWKCHNLSGCSSLIALHVCISYSKLTAQLRSFLTRYRILKNVDLSFRRILFLWRNYPCVWYTITRIIDLLIIVNILLLGFHACAPCIVIFEY